VRIASVGLANPPVRVTQARCLELVRSLYGGVLSRRSLDVLKQVLAHPSILARFLSFDTELEVPGLVREDRDLRMERFTRWSTTLSRQSAETALAAAGVAPEEIREIVVNTCTGYICPGVSTYLLEAMGLDGGVRVFDVVGSGCGGALPNLDLATRSLQADPTGVVLSVAVEVCSATFEMDDDMSLLISNAIFGDGAAVAVLWTRPEGLRIVDSIGRIETSFREDVRYVYKRGSLHNRLSLQLPKVVRNVVPPLIDELLARHGLTPSDVRYWAIHPGGDRMVAALEDALGLTAEQMAPTREVLADFGNMSSPTVLFILKKLMDRGIEPGEWVLMTAYGAGMSAYACLLRA
jgi:predicted naringenin-chalcone synthase